MTISNVNFTVKITGDLRDGEALLLVVSE